MKRACVAYSKTENYLEKIDFSIRGRSPRQGVTCFDFRFNRLQLLLIAASEVLKVYMQNFTQIGSKRIYCFIVFNENRKSKTAQIEHVYIHSLCMGMFVYVCILMCFKHSLESEKRIIRH